MNSKLVTLASAAVIALTAVAIPNQAEARWRGGGWWIPGAVIGGLALGALAARPYYYGPGYYGYAYGPGPYYGYGGGPYSMVAPPGARNIAMMRAFLLSRLTVGCGADWGC
jgi:hypothetical protein